MLCTTSYTAPVAGDRSQALAMIKEASRAARDLPHAALAARLFRITPASVRLYAMGARWTAGNAGAALEAGRELHEAHFETGERKGLMRTDMARALLLWESLSRPQPSSWPQMPVLLSSEGCDRPSAYPADRR
ncbi:hypothetical protein [Streptomyces sp. NPDC056707]|uniref:hypothetical protein n=1 Tax=Streptomyces sp. NPDC056707 TaxID=3345919 RepID=UPI0036C3B249